MTSGVKLVQGKGGALSVQLDGKNQTLTLGGAGTWLPNPGSCQLGFTITFSTKLQSLCDNMYILTSGGDLDVYSGVALYYYRKWTYVTVSTQEHRWTLRMDQPKLEEFVDYEISWGQDVGLQVTVGQKIHKTRRYSMRSKLATLTSNVIIGGPLPGTRGCYSQLIFGGLQIFTAPKPVLDAVGIITGMNSIVFIYNLLPFL